MTQCDIISYSASLESLILEVSACDNLLLFSADICMTRLCQKTADSALAFSTLNFPVC